MPSPATFSTVTVSDRLFDALSELHAALEAESAARDFAATVLLRGTTIYASNSASGLVLPRRAPLAVAEA